MTELFDDFTETYRDEVERSIGFAGGNLDHYTALKVRHLLDAVARYVGDPAELTFLDVGCGTGETDRHLVGAVDHLIGVDVAHGPVRVAASRNPGAEYKAYDGTRLPLGDDSVDVSFAICVMHHVSPAAWHQFLAEMRRVTRCGGAAIVFEHNPFNPLTRKAVGACEFDADAVLLRRAKVVELMGDVGLRVAQRSYIVFFPFGGERAARPERLLRGVPLGAQHVVVGIAP